MAGTTASRLIHDMAAEGLTSLVSTHCMDGADRSKRIVYLSDGRIVVQGAPDDIARRSGLVILEASGAEVDVDKVARRLRKTGSVEAAAFTLVIATVAAACYRETLD